MSRNVVPVSKRLLDLVFIVLSSPLTLLTFLIVAGYIKLRSPGPIFFKQKRIGLNGTPFNLFKFRTMKTNADTAIHEKHVAKLVKGGWKMRKLDSIDSRIIPGCKMIRAAGLDELPQLINVICGEMSIVGPRPCTLEEKPLFPNGDRFRVLPGLTGLWQVSGKNKTTFDQMVDFDIQYAKKRTILMDLNIMASTPFVMVNQATSSAEVSSVPSLKEFDTEFLSR